jgi:hypothetical protein
MGTATARTLLLSLTALALVLVALNLAAYGPLRWTGDAGWVLAPGAPYRAGVASVSPRGPAAAAGVREGDQVDLRVLGVADRTAVIDEPLAFRPLVLTLHRGAALVRAKVVPRDAPLRWDTWLGNAIIFWMALFGGLIAWRRPQLAEARLLSLALSCYVIGDVLQWIVTPSTAVNLLAIAGSSAGIFGAIALGSFVAFGARFGTRSRARTAVEVVAYAILTLLGAYGIAASVAIVTLWLDPADLYMGMLGLVLACTAQCVVIIAAVVSLCASHGAARQRVAWALLAFGPLLATFVLQVVLNAIVPTRDMALATGTFVNLAAIVAPVGLTYAVMSRRLLDVGFVLNRAAVFSIVSLIVVGTFMLVEWALGNWLTNGANVVISAALAIGLGFSIRFIHERVDRIVDRAFFRRRHEQEQALCRFAREAAFMTSVQALLERTVTEMTRHSDATSVVVLMRDANGGYVSGATFVEDNEPAIVAMRATLERVDLHAHPGRLPGEFAFPLVSRGELLGVLVCGPKERGDPYTPDELRTFDTVAHAVGVALGALGIERAAVHQDLGELQFEIAALRAEVRRLADALGPASLLERVTPASPAAEA